METALIVNNGFVIALRGRNLLDKDYAVSGFGFIGYNVFLGPARSWEISMKKSF